MSNQCNEDRFLSDVKNHSLKILNDDRIDRHIRFKSPGTSTHYFDLITIPGMLIISGDMGTYVFQRLTDMFEFFRKPVRSDKIYINRGYWAEEAQRKFAAGREKELQRLVSQELFRRKIWFRTSQMNKRTTGKVGEPDFIACVNSRFLGIECKAVGGKLSPEQAAELEAIRRSGGFTVVAFSLQDVITAINIIQGIE